MNHAIIKDINKEYIQAVEYYESNIITDNSTLDDYINLSFLYWAFASQQMEFVVPHNIPQEWCYKGAYRYSTIIDMGLSKYPDSLELNFWNRYYNYYSLGLEGFSEEDCKDLVKKYNDTSLVPYFFLQLFDKVKYKNQVSKLLALCLKEQTAKNLFIKSFIDR